LDFGFGGRGVTEAEFKSRTTAFALRVIRLVRAMPKGIIARQLLRSGTSIGTNYRSACRARSVADMLSRLGVVEEEADETLYWLELLTDSGLVSAKRLAALMDECSQILAMTVASITTLRRRNVRANPKSKIQNPKSNV
jgi:four helix bundle protein